MGKEEKEKKKFMMNRSYLTMKFKLGKGMEKEKYIQMINNYLMEKDLKLI